MTSTGAVAERIDDARLLWQEGRREGAFLMALVAVEVRARQDYPPPMRPGKAFGHFIESRFNVRLSAEYRGELWPIEDILYKGLRSELVHQGSLPIDIGFMEDAAPGELSVRAGGTPEFKFLVSTSWFDQLLVWAAS